MQKVDVGLMVRKSPSLKAEQTGLLSKGTKKVYTHYVDAEGIRWVKLKDGGYAARRSWDEGLSTSQRSGVSMQFRFLDVNSALAAKAASLERAENAINRLVYLWTKKNAESIPSVNYPSSFDVLSLTDTIETTFQIVEANISSTLNKNLLKNLVSKALPVVSEDIKAIIEQEIEAGDGTITPSLKNQYFARYGLSEGGQPGEDKSTPSGESKKKMMMNKNNKGDK